MSKKRPVRRQSSSATSNAALEQAKLAALKELAYGASHEINNPLANISTRAQTLLRMETDPEKRRMLAAIHAQAMRAHEMIADLMLFARPPQLNFTQFDLVEHVQRLAGEMQAEAAERDVEIISSAQPASIDIMADATQLAVALRALLQNAQDVIAGKGRIEITVGKSKGAATITVADDGPGIPAEIRPHIFEPFYSGREAGRGLGFGLSKCWRIISDHGGQIYYTENRPRGASFRITLPLVAGVQNVH